MRETWREQLQNQKRWRLACCSRHDWDGPGRLLFAILQGELVLEELHLLLLLHQHLVMLVLELVVERASKRLNLLLVHLQLELVLFQLSGRPLDHVRYSPGATT
jgi:hypothetical protein